jgi:hypothetical protein
MLAFTDSAFARLAIAATRIAPEQRERWLQEIAAKLDPPPVSRTITPAAIRQRKVRANRAAGKHCYRLWISDRAVCGLIMRLVLDGRLTEQQALKPKLVAQALAQLLQEEGQRCARRSKGGHHHRRATSDWPFGQQT